MKRYAIFSCLGLGDGLIALVLSNNLHLNGFQTTTFHPFLQGLQSWFPELPLSTFSSQHLLQAELASYDGFFIFYEKSPWMQALLSYCEREHPHKTTVLNPIATRRTNYPYWEGGKFDGGRSFVDNLVSFCQHTLCLKQTTKKNGIHPPENVEFRRYPHRIVLHATSSRPSKNWSEEKYATLAKELSAKGYDPVFVLSKEEAEQCELKDKKKSLFDSIRDLSSFVYESGYMIGNDSGIGHLASCLNIPTVTICRNHQVAQFWQPAWSKGEVVTPYPWIPNLKGLRLRDQHWKKWISVRRVLNGFLRLAQHY